MPYKPMILAAFLTFGTFQAAPAQDPGIQYPAPRPGTFVTTSTIRYGTTDTTALHLDLYRPGSGASTKHPVLIFLYTSSGSNRRNEFYASWARVAASQGIAAIVPDLDGDQAPAEVDQLITFIRTNAARYHLNADAIATYAGSGNVFTALPIIEDSTRTAIKAAVILYGTAPVTTFRHDLPLLYIRAGLDRPAVTGTATTGVLGLAAQMITANAPVTLINNATGHHAFELADNDAVTHATVDQILAFVKSATSAPYQAALHASLTEAIAAAAVVNGDFHTAATSYATLAAAHPDDARVHLAYGEALIGDKQYTTACATLNALKGKGLGARDLGLPAARACALDGQLDLALTWLRSIPARFMPPAVEQDSAFTALATRAEFRAIFH